MFFVASSLLVLQPSFCCCCIYQSQMICDISAISTLSLSLHIFTCHQILIKRLIGLIYILLDIQKICVYRSLEGEYDYQSWSVKGIPGIVRDKGILGSTKGLRKCVFSEAWRGIWLSKLISEGNSWDCPWQRHINADWSPVNANTGTNFYLGLIVKQKGTIIVL